MIGEKKNGQTWGMDAYPESASLRLKSWMKAFSAQFERMEV